VHVARRGGVVCDFNFFFFWVSAYCVGQHLGIPEWIRVFGAGDFYLVHGDVINFSITARGLPSRF